MLDGILQLHGIVHDVSIQAEVGATATGADGRRRTTYTARSIVDRQSFGLHWNQDLDVGGIVVGDEIEIVARIEAVSRDGDTQDVGSAPPAWPG